MTTETNKRNPEAWIIRPYPHGKYRVKEFLTKNIVAIGWPLLGDLSNMNSREDVKYSITKHYPHSSNLSLGQTIGNICRFRFDIFIDDLVIMPDGPIVYFGKIISDYRYDESLQNDNEGYPHQRLVEWYYERRAIPRNLLTGRLFDSLKGRQTIFATYYQDVIETVNNRKLNFTEKPNFELKIAYLAKLQQGLIRGVNSNTFEYAVLILFSKYFPDLRRLSTTNSEIGDSDLLAELPAGINVRIQVKHFYPSQGEIKEWVVDQLANSMESGDHGIIITSGVIGQSAIDRANGLADKYIDFIDGAKFVEMLFENIDEIEGENLPVFGLTRELKFL